MPFPLSFGWRDVLFSNWPVDGDHLEAHLPDALSVDEHAGAGWLSIVAFRNVRTRPRPLSATLGVDFPELNLRTYVTCDGEPGVYFFSLDASTLLGVVGARVLHRLPYYYARIGFRARGGQHQFASRRLHPGARPAQFRATYEPTGESFVTEPESRAAFLTERRRLYTQGQDGSVRYTDVCHERWTLSAVTVSIEQNTLFRANGFADPNTDPVHYYSRGVDVETSWNRRWRSV